MTECGNQHFKANRLKVLLAPQPRLILASLPAYVLLELITWFIWLFQAQTTGGFHTWTPVSAVWITALVLLATVLVNGNRAHKLTLSDRGIGIETAFGCQRQVAWSEVWSVGRSMLGTGIRIKTTRGTYEIGRELAQPRQLQLIVKEKMAAAIPIEDKIRKDEIPAVLQDKIPRWF